MGHRGPRPPEYRGQAKVSTEERKRSILNRENFGETNGTSARKRGRATAQWPAAKASHKLSRSILTDRSDSQIAEDPESVSTAQGGYARGRAPTLVAQLVLELVEVQFHKGLTSQDHAVCEITDPTA